MRFVFLITGLALVFAISWLVSYDRHHIKYRRIAILLVMQFVISFLCLHTAGGIQIMAQISTFFSWLMDQAAAGVSFVFGNIVIKPGQTVFFFNVLMPIVFIAALIGILNYLKILPFVVKWAGRGLNKIVGMGELESYFAVSTVFLGMPEVFITIKDQLTKLDQKRLYTICASAMSAVSASLLASYMKMIPGKFVLVAVFLNILSALIISCIINPYDLSAADNQAVTPTASEEDSFFQMLGNYIMDGFNIAITVGAMVLGFVALIAFLNNCLTALIHISFTEIIGYVFAPVAWLMGVPQKDIVQAGSLMATKLFTNEFVAMADLQAAHGLTAKTTAIISTYLVSFANFGSIGIITGSMKSIGEKQGAIVAKFTMKLLLGATLASVITSTIVGVFY
ncbi:NupC/NupG family nucleoside CNT transporter [Lactobacillus sp. DCY120]|uniref:NupC/NupG family nucleoside CNT transporter n=1 Tax=Bombilactobacillus apium TaxID=2675299 RepID=A0A850RA72_9LACO|nr:nucleoside transporter C-terminal domain-containing protein [Bombilactobacillus apium]NVY96266.1 NupC/NupG family nucleoside CNT transporter [Bombilactobacillus apium]